MTQAYPLQWPSGKPRTVERDRKHGRFNSKRWNGRDTQTVDLSIADALGRLQDELERIDARHIVLSSNLERRLDGLPRSGQREPDDPGVCAFFELKGDAVAMPCDTYHRAADNIAAIAAHIEATRKIERHGVASVAEMFSGFMALPSPESVKHWWEVLGVDRTAGRDSVERAWRDLRKIRHPDTSTGSTAAFQDLQEAYEQGLRANA